MVCNHCGTELPDDSMFCFICGEQPNTKNVAGNEQSSSGASNNEADKSESISEEMMHEFLEKLRSEKNVQTAASEEAAVVVSENKENVEEETKEVQELVETETVTEEAHESVEAESVEEVKESVETEKVPEFISEEVQELEEPETATEEVQESEDPETTTEEVQKSEDSVEEKTVEVEKEEVIVEKIEEPVVEVKVEEEKKEEINQPEETKEIVVGKQEESEAVKETKEESEIAEVETVEEQVQEQAVTEAGETQEPAEVETATEEVQEPAETETTTEEVQEPAEVETTTEEVQEPAEAETATEEVQEPAEAETTTEEVQKSEDSAEEKTEELKQAEESAEKIEEPADKEKGEEEKAEENNQQEATKETSEVVANDKLLDADAKEKLGVTSFYTEHIDYEKIKEEKTEKIDKIVQRTTTVVFIIILLIIAAILIKKHLNNREYTDMMKQAEKYCEEGKYDEAVSNLKAAREMEVADYNDIANKIADIYVSLEDYETAATELIYSYKNYDNNPDIYSRYQEYNAYTVADGDDSDKEADTPVDIEVPEETKEPASSDTPEETEVPEETEEPIVTEEPAVTEEPIVTETPVVTEEPVVTEAPSVTKAPEQNNLMTQIENALNSYYLRGISNSILNIIKANSLSQIVNGETTFIQNGKIVNSIESGVGMALYPNGYIYYGGWSNGLKHGKGIYLTSALNNGVANYYVYNGNWVADYPEGNGVITSVNSFGQPNESSSVTSGTFTKGLEHGNMKLKKIVDGKFYGLLDYVAVEGVPKAIVDANGVEKSEQAGTYVIGEYIRGTEKIAASVTNGTICKVEGIE